MAALRRIQRKHEGLTVRDYCSKSDAGMVSKVIQPGIEHLRLMNMISLLLGFSYPDG